MNDMFDAPTGGGLTPITSGSPEYQKAIVGNTQASLKPAYTSALNRLRQSYASRGLLDSGLGAAAEMGMSQNYLGQIGDVANRAAIGGADLAENNRQRLEQRGWQVQDRDLQLQALRDQADRAERAAGQKQWADLIGGVAMAGGTAAGGPFGAYLASLGTKGVMSMADQGQQLGQSQADAAFKAAQGY
jgi:hypothetical protein